MASRTYLAPFSHVRLAARATTPAVYRRSYAASSVVAPNKNRPPATAKKITATEHLSSASNPKLSVKTASRTHVSASGPPAKAASKNVSKTATKPAAQPQAIATQEEQMAQLDQLLAFAQYMPTADIWGQKTETLDGLKGMWSQFWKNRLNDVKNMMSMSTLASYNAFPGVDTANDRFFKKLFKWPIYIFGTRSISPSSWVAPSRKVFLDTYKQFNAAIARNDLKEVKRLATDSFLADTLAAQKKRSPHCTYIWRFHREVNPTQIVSLRVTEGYLSPEDPKFGNRLMVHALVKFNTEQSLEIYDRRGNALHTPAAGSTEMTKEPVPAETQRVIQYLVLEKRMWYDGPWSIRDQVWEVIPKKSS
ncbi:hypothetical protein AN958_05835 [Leucoagaricus sp. SymC.cos]|nr:hypothetical protein AN958_05835 [Leucoagaricus sp. SymC.cos]